MYMNRRGSLLLQMNADIFYIAISGYSIDKIIKPDIRQQYESVCMAEILVKIHKAITKLNGYLKRIPGVEKDSTRVLHAFL